MTSLFWANVLLVLHFVYVLGVILPVPLILLGRQFQWSWVRNIWFRTIHLGMVLAVVIPDLLGIPCPMTVWEQDLRFESGELENVDAFVPYWIERVLYYDFSTETFTIIYLSFGILIGLLFLLVPPQRHK